MVWEDEADNNSERTLMRAHTSTNAQQYRYETTFKVIISMCTKLHTIINLRPLSDVCSSRSINYFWEIKENDKISYLADLKKVNTITWSALDPDLHQKLNCSSWLPAKLSRPFTSMTSDDVMASWRAVPIRRGRFQPLALVTPFQGARWLSW